VLGDGEPKYLNSPETELFSKRNVLFGLDQAEAAAKEQGHFVVVEGYMDVIAAHQRGVSHVVGTLGTSLTREHARAMARVASRAVLLFDGDAGGQRAADRGAAILLQEGLDVSVVSLPQGLDPDDWFRDHDAAAFADFVASAGEDLIDYLIRRAGERNGSESLAGRGRAVREVMEAAAEVTDPVLFDLVVKRVAGAYGLDEGVVRKAGRPRGGSPWTRRSLESDGGNAVPTTPERGRRLGWEWDEIYVLGGVLTDSALASRAADELSLEDFQDAGRRGVFQQALNLLRAGRVPTSSVILETIGGDSAARGALTDLIAHEVPRGDSPAQALQRLLRRRDEEEYRRVRDTVSGAASRQDEEAVNEVLRRVSEFHRRRVARPSGGGTREAEDRAAD
jgi:DNA primase